MQARAVEEARAREARAEFERQQALALGKGEIQAHAQASLLWSLGALVLCCVPGPQIMAIVRYMSARAASRRLGLPMPAKGTAGLVLAVASMLAGVAFLTWAFIRSDDLEKKATARVAAIDAELASKPSAPILDVATACALAERYALTEGYDGNKGFYLTRFECAGKLSADAERAELEDFVFAQESNSKKYRRSACFKRGSKWYVTSLAVGRCPTAGGSTPAVATASSPPAATATTPTPPSTTRSIVRPPPAPTSVKRR
jgi:hypothetical protein